MYSKLSTFYRLFLLLMFVTIQSLQAQDIPAQPNPPQMVCDFVMKLNPTEKQALEQKLRAYRDSTSTEIAIVIVKNTGEYDPYDYALKLATTWGVGDKKKDNGVLILWATETKKIRILTGRGIEGPLPDGVVKRIINTIIVPAFKQGQWYQGLDEATTEIIKRANGEFQSDASGEDDGGVFFVIFVLVIIFIIIAVIISKKGGGGNGGRGFRNGGGWMPPIIMTGGGSNWDSGKSSGGGGGFDFGGFGGGDFGGGGAGGDY